MTETFFITGANRGIGLALTRECLAQGHRVLATARHPELAAELAALRGKHPGRLHLSPLDVNDDASVARILEEVDFPVIDVLINNAAIFPERGDETLEELDLADLTLAFATNVIGPVRVTRALLPRLQKSANPRVVNISSTAGSIWRKNTRQYYAYSTSKAALNMITRSMAFELKERGISLVAVTPGWVRTEMGGDEAPLTPEESARALVETCRRLTLEQAGSFLERDGEPSRAAW